METDEQLMQRLRQGEREALSALYDRHAPSVLGVLFKIVGNRGVAEELLQETFWRVWDKGDGFDPKKGKFTTWMYSIARRLAIDTLRRRKSRPQAADGEYVVDMLEQLPATNNVAATVSLGFQNDAVRDALSALSPEQREIIELAYFKGLTRREIAKERNIPLGTVHTRARLALQRLRGVLTERGWGDSV